MRRIALAVAFLLVGGLTLGAQERGIEVLEREATGGTAVNLGRQYAVVIGIDRYREWPSLRSAVSEAKAVKSVLERRYWIDEFIELYDEEATAANIRRLFQERLPAKLGLNDSLLVFYAGHGYLDKTKTGFWIASDGTKDLYDQRGWIPNQQLRNMIGDLKAQRILVLADACFAGDFLDTRRGPPAQIDSSYYRKALSLTARQVLTSGSSESVPDESEFGRQLVNMLERNTENLLDPNQMYDRIKLGVSKTQPLFGTLPGNEQGASFVLFLKQESATRAGAQAHSPVFGAVSTVPGEVHFSFSCGGSLSFLGNKVDIQGTGSMPVSQVQPGSYEATMTYSDGHTERKSFRVDSAVNTGVSFSYAPRGVLTVISEPSGARVFVGGIERGQTPLTLRDLAPGYVEVSKLQGTERYELVPAGSYKLEAWGTGYESYRGTIYLGKGEDKRVEPWTTGKLVVSSDPPGAVVTVGSRERGQTPFTVSADPGYVEVSVRREGYEDISSQKLIEVGKTTQVAFVLKKLPERPSLPADLAEMVLVPSGSFQMGSNEYSSEKPVHDVRVSDFYIGKYEVTQRLWLSVMGTNPSYFKGDDLPVEQVIWYEAVNFCNKLSAREGLKPAYTISGTSVSCDWTVNGYRLPTEAEWEYATRGGQAGLRQTVKYAGSDDPGQVAWYSSNSGSKTHPVGQKAPNALGLYDMSGNVWEWCWDWKSDYSSGSQTNPTGPSSGSSRVLRGGSWDYDGYYLRSTNRYRPAPDVRYGLGGFRVVVGAGR